MVFCDRNAFSTARVAASKPPSACAAEGITVRSARESAIAICKKIDGQPWKSCNSRRSILANQHDKSKGSEFFTDDGMSRFRTASGPGCPGKERFSMTAAVEAMVLDDALAELKAKGWMPAPPAQRQFSRQMPAQPHHSPALPRAAQRGLPTFPGHF